MLLNSYHVSGETHSSLQFVHWGAFIISKIDVVLFFPF